MTRRSLRPPTSGLSSIAAVAVLATLVATTVALALAGPAASTTGDLLVHDVNLLPMDGDRIIAGVDVLIAGGKIVAIGRAGTLAIPTDATTTVDAADGFLLPGLRDMHVHISSEADLAMLLAHGVTGARDMFGSPQHLELRERVRAGEIAVREQAEAGCDFIKVYNNVPAEAYRGVVEEARRRNLPVAGHVPFEVGLEGAIAASQASLEHLRGYVWELVPANAPEQPGADLRSRTVAWNHADTSRLERLAEASRTAGVWNTPTLNVGLLFKSQAAIEAYLSGPEDAFVNPGWADVLRDRTQIPWLSNFSAADFEAAEKGLAIQRRLVAALAAVGAPILAGTDSPPWGLSLHTELRELVNAGLTPYQALAAATLNAAEFLGLADGAGRVAVDSPADLVLVRDNPLEDIGATLGIVGVVRRGEWLDREALDRLINASGAPRSSTRSR